MKSEKQKEYERQWRKDFKDKHGVSYTTYRERLQVAKVIAKYETTTKGNKSR